ncbi:MAG: glutathione S-transferase family protein [Undibacterium umbellatum]|uniref:glutathione S-transferase family protein n=1 Tax=Undibacterium umbellatum TaxID=2762300 RepID=UPI003BB4C41E
MTSKPYQLHGWHLSYFTGKVMCYLNYKKIPYVYQQVNFWTLTRTGKRKTGEVVMPLLVTPDEAWLQDSSVMIDYLEALFPQAPVIPHGPVQKFASYLMEAWGDEWWVPIAMHTRWNYPENYALFEREAGNALLPHFPRLLKKRAVAFVANKLRGMLHAVGVRPEQHKMMNEWTINMLDLLEQHFSRHAYLFGDAPTIGDFGLVGTMYGHLGRDPWPARVLVAPRPHLRAWIDRMSTGKIASGSLLAEDKIAPTLVPIFKAICAEFIPMVAAINEQLKTVQAKIPAGKTLPRRLDEICMPMGNQQFSRVALPYTLWMVQRCLDVLAEMNATDQMKVRLWLQSVGGADLLTLEIPRLRRIGLRVALESGLVQNSTILKTAQGQA